jgi:hypothetical protein
VTYSHPLPAGAAHGGNGCGDGNCGFQGTGYGDGDENISSFGSGAGDGNAAPPDTWNWATYPESIPGVLCFVFTIGISFDHTVTLTRARPLTETSC